jgi:phasin family protein
MAESVPHDTAEHGTTPAPAATALPKAPRAKAPAKPIAPKPAKITAKPATATAVASKPAPTAAASAPKVRTASASTKEPRTMTTQTTEMTEKFQAVIKDASEKAKTAFEKSQASFGELGEFTKGNVEALVESTKILATGLQELSKSYLTETKSVMETMTAEFKALSEVKSPSELIEKQSTLLRKQFDAAVAASSKNSEAVLKLANEAFQPISTRVSLAVEKVKHAA